MQSRTLRTLVLLFVCVAAALPAQQRITTPKEFFGFNIGDDYQLANYDQFSAYWRKIDGESDRMRVVEIGKTAEGRAQLAAIVTAPQNFARLDRYKEISRRLALAEGLDSAAARALAREGKAVVWIDGGLHATEVLGAHQLIETSYQFVSRTDDETMRILNDVIIVFVHANPDGMQLVSNWYMSEQDPTRRNTAIPRLYQKYIGHDNNRDFYMSAQPETQNMNHLLYWEWFPQIMYNHHQTGPAGSVMFAPPFRDPHNHNFDRLIVTGIDLVGAAMHHRFVAENKPGVVMRRAAGYSTWWNGGLRTTVYFHNMIGLLTETIGSPTPMRIPLIPNRLEPTADQPYPIEPQEWHFRQSIDYSVTANYAVLDIASRYRETFLFNIWRMGMNSIERGRRDTWTTTGPEVDRLRAAADSARRVAQAAGQSAAQGAGQGGGGGGAGQAVNPALFERILKDPADRDPRAYVLPSSQADFPTATKFINTLRHVGVTVERATRDFTIGAKTYPAGSYVVPMAQAFRPHVLDMFEPQEHPNDFAYPGAPPTRPYDNAGYTLAFQMDVEFDRILDAYTCPCERITGLAAPMPGTVTNARGATGYILTPRQNDAFVAASRLMKANVPVSRLTSPFTSGGRTYSTGSFYVPATATSTRIVESAARELGIRVAGVTSRPSAFANVRMPRVALWDTYGGSMPSGWTRWIMEQYEIPFTVVYPAELNAGNLRAKYDVLVLPDGAIPNQGSGGFGGGQQRQPPDSLRHMGGRLDDQTVPHIRAFIEAGGEVLTIGSSTRLAYMLGLPVKNALVERTASGEERALPGEKYYIPGSLLEVAVDTTASIAWGSPATVDVMFDDSPAFRLDADAASQGLRTIAWYDSKTPLRSGWAWGQEYLDRAAAIVEARMGQGALYLFGPEILFRAQPHGTFRFFFNALTDPSRSPAPPTP